KDIIPNHVVSTTAGGYIDDPDSLAQLEGRALICRKAKPLPIEAIVRGYLVGSGWKEYQKMGTVCGIMLPIGIPQAGKLPLPLFTPSTKAEQGAHDENISPDEAAKILGKELADKVAKIAVKLYQAGADYAASRGVIVADTKFEFGLVGSELILIDEVLTPDSSRFWPADQYQVGQNPPSFDKQFVRDWLEASGWNKTPPPPALPAEVIQHTADKYREAYERITGGTRGL
ncbi:MAG: phosphoribosylaminoimidazolesuccinocarboxamide synthase, partial [candidate division FCPU426 bacterium]